jgi:hypothetical protein
VENESGEASVEAHVENAVAAERTRMAVTVGCLLMPVNWVNKKALPVFTPADIGLFITRHRGWGV